MSIYAIRRENETVEKLIFRFKKQVQHSRLVQKVRDKKNWKKSPTKRLERFSALKREEYRKKRREELD
jgi:ribosomal protein S21